MLEAIVVMKSHPHGPSDPTGRRPLALFSSFCVCCLLGALDAGAHVAWPDYHSARCAITLDDERLRVEVILEIPIHEVVLGFNAFYKDIDLIAAIEAGRIEELESSFKEAQFERLAAELSLSLDGKLAPSDWRPVDNPINGRGSEGFFVYMLELIVDEPSGGRRLEVSLRNDNFSSAQVMFANLTSAEGRWQVQEATVEQPPAGADLTIGSEAELALWSSEESRRRFDVTFKGKRKRNR